MNVKDLLKKATQLKKEKNIEEAIDMLDQAYSKGIYEPPSQFSDDFTDSKLDQLLNINDLVRKAKYLQELGKFHDSIQYIDNLIEKTSNRANYSVWEIDELSELHNHKAIILKKEKKFNDEFVERIKSYCLSGISATIKSQSNDDFLKKRFLLIQKNYLKEESIKKFILDNSKKTKIDFNFEQFIKTVQKVIKLEYKTEKIHSEFIKLI